MPRTRDKIIQRQRVFEPNDHLGRKLKTFKEVRQDVESDRIKGSKKEEKKGEEK